MGAPAQLTTTWFAGLLRDGFALTAAGSSVAFGRLAAESLGVTLYGHLLNRIADAAIEHVMKGFQSLPIRANVSDGIRSLIDLGIRLVALSKGAADVAEGLCERDGIRHLFERLLTVEVPAS